jgi:hypothetical protein
MGKINIVLKQTEQEGLSEEDHFWYSHIWSKLATPILDEAYYIDEIHYKIENRLYIENAD